MNTRTISCLLLCDFYLNIYCLLLFLLKYVEFKIKGVHHFYILNNYSDGQLLVSSQTLVYNWISQSIHEKYYEICD